MESPNQRTTRRLFRFINFVVDNVFVALLGYFIVIFGDGAFRNISDSDAKYYYLGLLFFYYLIFETLFARTLGKVFTNTKVVTKAFEKPSFGSILLRTIIRFVPLEVLTGFAYPWHDTWTNTKVVDVKK